MASVSEGGMIYWNYAQAHSGKQEDGKENDRLERIKTGMKRKGWRDSSVLKRTCCSIARTRIQVPSSTSDGSQMPVTPGPKDLMPSPIFYGHGGDNRHINTYTDGARKQNGSWNTLCIRLPRALFFIPLS